MEIEAYLLSAKALGHNMVEYSKDVYRCSHCGRFVTVEGGSALNGKCAGSGKKPKK